MPALKRQTIAIAALLGTAVLLVYGPLLSAPLFFDDLTYLLNNPGLARLGSALFSPQYFPLSLEASWRPLPSGSYAALWTLMEGAWQGYRLLSVLLHLANTLLVYLLARRLLTGTRLKAAAAAALFALHPLHVTTILTITFNEDLFVGLFVLMGLLAHLRWQETRTSGWLAAAATCLLCGLLSKESAALMLPAALLLDWQAGRKIRTHFKSYGTYLGVGFSFLIARIYLIGPPPLAALHTNTDPFWLRLGGAGKTLVANFSLLLWPGTPRMQTMLLPPDGTPAFLWGLLLIALISTAIWLLARKRGDKSLILFALWPGLFLLPVLNLVPFFHAYRAAARYGYLASVGLALFLVAFTYKHWPRRAPATILALCGVLFALALRAAAPFYLESEIARGVAHAAPKSAAAEYTWARALAREKMPERAWPHIERALELRDNDPIIQAYEKRLADRGIAAEVFPTLREIENLAGDLLIQLDQPRKAVGLYSQIILRRPDYAMAYGNLAKAYLDLGDHKQAQIAAQRATALDDGLIGAWVNLAAASNRLGDFHSGAHAARQALKRDPRNLHALLNFGAAQLRLGKIDDGAEALLRAVRLAPENVDALHNLAAARMLQRRGEAAVKLYQTILSLNPRDTQAQQALRMLGH
jgi:tetratricopeptide (TPR) repeat protein